MVEDECTLCIATAALLRASRVTAAWGVAMSFGAVLVLALTARSSPPVATTGFAAAALLGLLERYLAFRIAFDAVLFDALASDGIHSLSTLDGALHGLTLRPSVQPTRPLADRVGGARLLLRRHGLVVVAQTLAFALGLLAQG